MKQVWKKPAKKQQQHLQPNSPLDDQFEKARLLELTRYEMEARALGFRFIAGIDEAGRGPLAGPVVAAACIIPEGIFISGVDDSKQLSAKQRCQIYDTLIAHPSVHYGIGFSDAAEIDSVNIYQATILAMLRAVEALTLQPDYLLVDGMKLPHPSVPVLKIIKGDTLSQSIAAASIIAKETRDRLMEEYHQQWPHYLFSKHKGYGTAKHVEALREHGPCTIHRRTFEPVKSLVEGLG